MISIKQWMEICNYRITEGSDYQWQCFGYNAYRLDSWNGDQEGHTISILFDTKTQEVYQVEAFDYARERAYRMTNPDYKKEFDSECEDREILDCAWERDDGTPVNYVDLDVDEDFIEKATAIINDEDYDTRVRVPVDFTDDELLTYMKMAHDRDMTFNQFVEEALRATIEQYRDEQELINELEIEETVEKNKKRKKGKNK